MLCSGVHARRRIDGWSRLRWGQGKEERKYFFFEKKLLLYEPGGGLALRE
jgi:hypothetical protein